MYILSVHTRALTVNILSAVSVYTIRGQCPRWSTDSVQYLCKMHWWVSLQGTVHLQSSHVSEPTLYSASALYSFERTYSVYGMCTVLLWVILHCTVHVQGVHVSTFTVKTASTQCSALYSYSAYGAQGAPLSALTLLIALEQCSYSVHWKLTV